ncbi:two-component system catabolic regulation response regulator CreB [Roseimicrobium gellanilyticum]|uniref:Two-component system catabolic regulation response regulator CreB n=1 Tax=Roseimicrobium gellanilyticum TaxID=748857 RepID=A0A366HBS5_9BACT|nr:two-component system response regulator CreB [Roseimicrobium gellanilyticum]RBP39811.1 two-component system catabolic regulation response regulator CreB [Roseimicrobium gellanilyticum]
MLPPVRPRILIVEDEPSIADNIVYSLESEGFAPCACSTGAEAIARLEAEDFALAVLDVGLPDTTGFELCRELRLIKDVPVIFLTARSSELDRVVGLEIGGDDYICKPFSPRELTARVRAVLRRADHRPKGAPVAAAASSSTESSPAVAAAPPEESATPVSVDETRCQIRYFGEVLPLSRYEYRLLQTFAKHPGRVFSRAQLMEHASDEPEAAMERTVDAHVKSLRAKMKTVRNEVEPIVTHRGLGYSLAEKWV